MWLFWIYELLGLLAVIAVIFSYCKFAKHGFWLFIWQHLKWIVISILIVWLVIAILCRHHLYNATYCHFRGVSMHAETKYSLFLNECQIKTSSGAYVTIDRSRAYPDSKDDNNQNNDFNSQDVTN